METVSGHVATSLLKMQIRSRFKEIELFNADMTIFLDKPWVSFFCSEEVHSETHTSVSHTQDNCEKGRSLTAGQVVFVLTTPFSYSYKLSIVAPPS